MLGVPANANSNQTVSDGRGGAGSAGFEVLGFPMSRQRRRWNSPIETSDGPESLAEKADCWFTTLGGGTLRRVAGGDGRGGARPWWRRTGMPDFGGDEFDEILGTADTGTSRAKAS